MDVYSMKRKILLEAPLNNKRCKVAGVGFETLKKEYERAVQRADDAEKNFLESLKSRYEQEFTERATIGSGAYAQVRKCTHKLDGQDYAVKRIRFVGPKDLLLPEIQALSRLQHPGIVKYFTSWVEFDDIGPNDFRIIKFGELDDDKVPCYFDLCELGHPNSVPMSLYVQMELCNRCLSEDIESFGTMEQQTGLEYFKQILDAVVYMHQQQVYHRDLASSNIFISASSQTKIGDFGIAKIGDVDMHPTRLGQVLYTAPERKQDGPVDAAKVDIYSLGIILLELLSECQSTWDRYDKIDEFVKQGIIPEVVDQRYRELIVLLTSTDPTKRPSAAEIQEMLNKIEGGTCCAPKEQ